MNMPVAETANRTAKHAILSLTITDKAVLYAAYMPFLKNGGLFIPSTRGYEIGSQVFMLLKLMDDEERLPLTGTVAWIKPGLAQGNRSAGVGIHFNDVKSGVRHRIESILAGSLNSDKPTKTM